ncbi:NADH dehydrogenase [ubiquinone] 1 alpha subcomplex subunit 3 isoform 2-T2 [Sarcophilus harrisii]
MRTRASSTSPRPRNADPRGACARWTCPGEKWAERASGAHMRIAEGESAGQARMRLGPADTNPSCPELGRFLKDAWAKEPVLVASFAIGTMALILPVLSPYTKYSSMINQATPYNYPVPVRDNGKMQDIPSHPQDPEGPSLQWLKNL